MKNNIGNYLNKVKKGEKCPEIGSKWQNGGGIKLMYQVNNKSFDCSGEEETRGDGGSTDRSPVKSIKQNLSV